MRGVSPIELFHVFLVGVLVTGATTAVAWLLTGDGIGLAAMPVTCALYLLMERGIDRRSRRECAELNATLKEGGA